MSLTSLFMHTVHSFGSCSRFTYRASQLGGPSIIGFPLLRPDLLYYYLQPTSSWRIRAPVGFPNCILGFWGPFCREMGEACMLITVVNLYV